MSCDYPCCIPSSPYVIIFMWSRFLPLRSHCAMYFPFFNRPPRVKLYQPYYHALLFPTKKVKHISLWKCTHAMNSLYSLQKVWLGTFCSKLEISQVLRVMDFIHTPHSLDRELIDPVRYQVVDPYVVQLACINKHVIFTNGWVKAL